MPPSNLERTTVLGVVVTLMLVAGAACARHQRAADREGGSRASAPTEIACVDRWLVEHHLGSFGDPEGTVYVGGTPLFDEAMGTDTPRLQYVYARHPDAALACLADASASAPGATPSGR